MKFKYMIALAAVTLASLFVTPSAAEAKPARVPWNGKVVEIVSYLPSSWSVASAVEDVDWYTGSDMRLVKRCSRRVLCIEISNGHVNGAAVGWTYTCRSTSLYCFIHVDTSKAASKKYKKWFKYSSTKRWLIRHELGHNRGLNDRKVCDSTMDPYVRCRGKVPPNTFIKSQRSVLRAH